uniref:Uncharacterized protein n=1 Tax=Cucumis sativus TaxID=3659 RepID=A0A0A0KDP3_CUCSA
MNVEQDIQTQFRACFKSIDDIWSEIDHKDDQQNPHPQDYSIDVHQDSCQSPHAFGEMNSEASSSSSSSCSVKQQLCSGNANRSMVDLREIVLSLRLVKRIMMLQVSEICPGIAFQIIKCSPILLGNLVITIQMMRNVKRLKTDWVEPKNKKRIVDMVLLK